jgi:hypothetical protein
MPTKWITSRDAARILSENAGRTILPEYVRQLAQKGKIRTKDIDERTKLYSAEDASAYVVRSRGDGSVRRRLRPNEYEADKLSSASRETP